MRNVRYWRLTMDDRFFKGLALGLTIITGVFYVLYELLVRYMGV